jgi:hypothetical protein
VTDDVLGTYRFGGSARLFRDHGHAWIELYWGVIGLCAQVLGVSISALTIVVLSHEPPTPISVPT